MLDVSLCMLLLILAAAKERMFVSYAYEKDSKPGNLILNVAI